ncbi:hypothetical protein, partial [Bacillus pseudomycoides]|uniref:hypothetical protein n=1 Tax=Bacillus pseudomycoides TaxID=64104 RepID=UPI001C551C12
CLILVLFKETDMLMTNQLLAPTIPKALLLWQSNLFCIVTFRSATHHNEKGLRRLAAVPRHAPHGKEKDLGLCPHLQGELFPLTPSIELPNPSILEGLPRRLAGSKGYLLTNHQRVA